MTIPFAQTSFPELYEQTLVGPLFRPWVEDMLDAVALRPADRLLDVACGTGIVARVAKERLGERGVVAGVDLSPAMLAVARRVGAGIVWREGDAGALPLREGERFDVVVCQQGLQFFPDRAAAAGEMRRALLEGGRLAVSTWRPEREVPVGEELRHIAERHVGPISDRRHSFGEAAPLEALLRDAGFHDVRSKTLSRTIRFEDGSVFIRLNAMALVGMSGGSQGMDEAARERAVQAIVRDSAGVLEQHSNEAGFTFRLGTNLVTARG